MSGEFAGALSERVVPLRRIEATDDLGITAEPVAGPARWAEIRPLAESVTVAGDGLRPRARWRVVMRDEGAPEVGDRLRWRGRELTVLAAVAIAWAYARAEAQALVPIEYSGFLWAILFGWLFFREAVTLPTVLGAALIVTGCWIAAPRERKRPLPEPTLPEPPLR